MPYLAKWASGRDVESPVFHSVRISNTLANATSDYVDFVGTYSPETNQPEGDNTILLLGDDNKLYYPAAATTIKAFRGYLVLKNGIKASSSDGDLNGDNKLSIADVTSLVNVLIDGSSQTAEAGKADLNADQNVSVEDVVTLVSVLLGKNTSNVMRTIRTDEAIGISYGFGCK